MEKCGQIWKNSCFSGRLRPDWGLKENALQNGYLLFQTFNTRIRVKNIHPPPPPLAHPGIYLYLVGDSSGMVVMPTHSPAMPSSCVPILSVTSPSRPLTRCVHWAPSPALLAECVLRAWGGGGGGTASFKGTSN